MKTLFVAILLFGSLTYAQKWWDYPDPDYDWSYGATYGRSIPSSQSALYRAAGTDWLWVNQGSSELTYAADQLRGVLLNADRHGLNPADYWTPSLEKQYQNPRRDPESFERAASAVLIKFATHVAVGRVSPGEVGPEVRVAKRSLGQDAIGRAVRDTWDLQGSIDDLAPRWPEYGRLQRALVRLKRLNPEIDFPETPAPKVGPRTGESHDLVSRVKTRLRALGYPLSETGPVYTQELLDTLRKYYADNAIPGEANLQAGSPFWVHLGASLPVRMQQIRLTMEKLRWMPADPGDRYFSVNLALQKLRIYENGQLVMEMRTINGRPNRKTPTLKDKLTTIELNPSWTVPAKLVLEDKVPAILKDPNYLRTYNYQVFDANGREIDPAGVDWAALTEDTVGQYTLRQQPGTGNALGVMKFHLANPYAIYMHDTNERWLFADAGRLYSWGCIRLEKPMDVAMYLLRDQPKWSTRQAIEAKLATTTVAGPGVDRMFRIAMKKPIAVYTNYLTVEADDGAPLKFATDFYGQDQALYNVLKGKGYKGVNPRLLGKSRFDEASMDGP